MPVPSPPEFVGGELSRSLELGGSPVLGPLEELPRLGSVWDRSGVALGLVWGRSGSVWGWFGIGLGSVWKVLGMFRGDSGGDLGAPGRGWGERRGTEKRSLFTNTRACVDALRILLG